MTKKRKKQHLYERLQGFVDTISAVIENRIEYHKAESLRGSIQKKSLADWISDREQLKFQGSRLPDNASDADKKEQKASQEAGKLFVTVIKALKESGYDSFNQLKAAYDRSKNSVERHNRKSN